MLTYSLGSGTMLLYCPATATPAASLGGQSSSEPAVHREGELACVFFGQLESESLHELSVRYLEPALGSPRGKRCGGASTAVAAASSPASVLQGLPPAAQAPEQDPRQLAAALVLAMYRKEGRASDSDPAVLLSELQGRFSFIVVDAAARQVLAARAGRVDATPLFYELSDEGVSVASTPLALPMADWVELPPGHLLSGRQVQQYSLTPEQLSWRASYEYRLVAGGRGRPLLLLFQLTAPSIPCGGHPALRLALPHCPQPGGGEPEQPTWRRQQQQCEPPLGGGWCRPAVVARPAWQGTAWPAPKRSSPLTA